MSLKLEVGINTLIEEHRYFGEVIQRMKRKKCNDIPTMGVSFENQSVLLYYNEYFLNSLSKEELSGVLNHECSHIINDHYNRELELEPDFDRKSIIVDKNNVSKTVESFIKADLLNMCEDVAINQWIPTIPLKIQIFDKKGKPVLDERETVINEKSLKKHLNSGNKIKNETDLDKFKIKNKNYKKPIFGEPCTLESFKKLLPDNINIQEKMPFEYYYNLLKEQGHDKKTLEQTLEQLENIMLTLDQHDMEKASKGKNEKDPEMRKELAREIANEAKKACEDAGVAGNIPANILEALDALNKKPKNWKKDLNKFTARCSSIFQEITRSRRNRRQRKDEPLISGFRNKTNLKLIFAMDTSGSMSSEILEQIACEGKKLYDMGVKLLLIECDSQINNIREYKGEKELKVHGRGGTLFNPVFELINSKNFNSKWGNYDGIIFFTDGDCFDTNVIKPKIPILWAMNKNCKKPVDWGLETEIIIRDR